MIDNDNFPKAIVQYICQTSFKKLEGDGFVLLNSIFHESDFSDVITEEFIIALFNSFGVILEHEIFSSVVWIITSIANNQMDEEE